MSCWSQRSLDFKPFQTWTSSGISVFRLCLGDKSESRKVQAFIAGGGQGAGPALVGPTAGTLL